MEDNKTHYQPNTNIFNALISTLILIILSLIYFITYPAKMFNINSQFVGGNNNDRSTIDSLIHLTKNKGHRKNKGNKTHIRGYNSGVEYPRENIAIDHLLSQQQRDIITAYQHILNNRGLAGAIYEYKDINYSLNYSAEYVTEVLKCHIGQRKLNNTELQFYSRFIDKTGKNTLVIYIGSASGEHTGFILKRFPGIKILMVDPNFHNMEVPHMYVKQQLDRISQDTIKTFTDFLRADVSKDNPFSQRMKKLKDGAEKLHKMRFIYSDDPVDVLDAARKFRETGKIDEDVAYNNEAFDTDYVDLVAYIMKSKTDVFVIQDYATVDLAQKLRTSIAKYNEESAGNIPLNILFVSDIRTTVMSDHEPSALDIVWNNHLHSTMLNIIKPDFSMLKFHPPYFDDIDFVKKFYCDIVGNKIPNFDETKSESENVRLAKGERKKIYDFVIADIKAMKKYSDIGLTYDNSTGKFRYRNMPHKHIFIQSWKPPLSGESRMIVAKNNIVALERDYIEYDPAEWENKFYFYRFFRMAWAEDEFIEKLNKFLCSDKSDIRGLCSHTFDGCPDCYIEIRIIAEYLILRDPMFAGKDAISPEEINNKIILKYMDSSAFCEKIANISNEITDAVYFPAGKSSKCPGHGMRNISNVLYPYFIYRDDSGDIFLIIVEITPTDYNIIGKHKIINEGKNRLKFVPRIENVIANDGNKCNIVAVDGTPMNYRVFERMLLEDVF